MPQTLPDPSARPVPLVSVCVCTCRRRRLIRLCLESLANQNCARRFEVIVVDNNQDASESEAVLDSMRVLDEHSIPTQYVWVQQPGVDVVRNAALSIARGQFVAFLDDDEQAEVHWLERMVTCLETTGADGVFGPVIPVFPPGFVSWMKHPALFSSRNIAMHAPLDGIHCNTGNCLLHAQVCSRRPGPFAHQFGLTGGGDSEFFDWLAQHGARLVWCSDAVVSEEQDIARSSVRWHLVRAYRGGWGFVNILRHRERDRASVAKVLWLAVRGFLGAFIRAASVLPSVRVSALVLLTGIASQAGKLGCFLRFRPQEYARQARKERT